jgi:hypothetical protein
MELLCLSDWSHIVSYLDVKDVLSLSRTCKHLWHMMRSNELWRPLCLRDYGNVLIVMDILKSAEIPYTYSHPENYREYYVTKSLTWTSYEEEDTLPSTEHLQILEEDLMRAKSYLLEFSQHPSHSIALQLAIDLLLSILDRYPLYADVYALCALVCLQFYRIEEAYDLITMYLEFGLDNYHDLVQEINRLYKTLYEGSRIPLVTNQDLSPSFKAVLLTLFQQFDQDGDGAWSPQEFKHYIEITNGSSPSLPKICDETAFMYSCTRLSSSRRSL